MTFFRWISPSEELSCPTPASVFFFITVVLYYYHCRYSFDEAISILLFWQHMFAAQEYIYSICSVVRRTALLQKCSTLPSLLSSSNIWTLSRKFSLIVFTNFRYFITKLSLKKFDRFSILVNVWLPVGNFRSWVITIHVLKAKLLFRKSNVD